MLVFLSNCGFFITIEVILDSKARKWNRTSCEANEKAIDSKNPEADTSVIDIASSVDNSLIEKRILDWKRSKLLQTEGLNDRTTKNTIQTVVKEASQTGARENSLEGMIEVK